MSDDRLPLGPRPETPEALADLVRREFGAAVPARPICPGHNAPMDYLTASFFGQEDALVWACRGGGKTYLAAIATVLNAVFDAPLTVLVLGGSFDQSNRLGVYIRDIVQRRDLAAGRVTRSRVTLRNGSQIHMLPQSEQAVRGRHVQKIRCDEVELFDPDVWRAVQFSTRSAAGVRGSIEVLSTLHRPGGLMQHLVNQARDAGAGRGAAAAPRAPGEEPPPGYRLIQWCLWEVIERCPDWRRCADCLLAEDCRGVAREASGFFRIDDAIAIEARSSRAAWEAEMLCLGPQREHVVFHEFQASRHVCNVAYCADWPLYRAIDFGYRSPLACLWVQVTPGGCVHVIDEYIRARLPLALHAREIRRRDPGPVAMTYVDPAGRQRESGTGQACTEILAAADMPCAWRASTIRDGLELIRCALAPAVGEPALVVAPRCTKLISAFNAYHYAPPGAAGAGSELPVKDGPDHPIDALRYFFVNRFRPRVGTHRDRY